MHFLIKILAILAIIFDNVAVGLISLHNGRVVRASNNNDNFDKPPAPSGRLLRPKRRDASVFKLKFLDGTDTDAFEFVDAGSGWNSLNGNSYVDRSPTSGPHQLAMFNGHDTGDDYIEPDDDDDGDDGGGGETLQTASNNDDGDVGDRYITDSAGLVEATTTVPNSVVSDDDRHLANLWTVNAGHSDAFINKMATTERPFIHGAEQTATTPLKHESSTVDASSNSDNNYNNNNVSYVLTPSTPVTSFTKKQRKLIAVPCNGTTSTTVGSTSTRVTTVSSSSLSTATATTTGNPCFIVVNTLSTLTPNATQQNSSDLAANLTTVDYSVVVTTTVSLLTMNTTEDHHHQQLNSTNTGNFSTTTTTTTTTLPLVSEVTSGVQWTTTLSLMNSSLESLATTTTVEANNYTATVLPITVIANISTTDVSMTDVSNFTSTEDMLIVLTNATTADDGLTVGSSSGAEGSTAFVTEYQSSGVTYEMPMNELTTLGSGRIPVEAITTATTLVATLQTTPESFATTTTTAPPTTLKTTTWLPSSSTNFASQTALITSTTLSRLLTTTFAAPRNLTFTTTLPEDMNTTTAATTTTISSSAEEISYNMTWNGTGIPFSNLNIARVRMSVHVTSIFTRKQLEQLLQQGIQNALVNALNRNNRVDDDLFELKRIIRMTNPNVEVMAVAVPETTDKMATVTYLNVTFGAMLQPSRADGVEEQHHANHTVKSHLVKHALPGRHVREILLSVPPIELSAAAGIPIEEIRPVNEDDYDLIVNNWRNSSLFADDDEEGDDENGRPEQLVPVRQMPDWVLPVVICMSAFVLLLVYCGVTAVCALKGYRLRLEKVGAIAAASSDGGSYAEGAARLAEVVSSPNRQMAVSGSPTNFAVQPLAPVNQMLLPTESASPKLNAAKQQLGYRRWTLDGQSGQAECIGDPRIISRLQQQAMSFDVGDRNKAKLPAKQMVSKATAAQEVTLDKSMNTSTVLLHTIGTATEGPEFVNRASSASHHHSRAVGTSSQQFQVDQSTDTTADIGQKMKSIQTATVASCFNSTTKDSARTPDSAGSGGAERDVCSSEAKLQSKNRRSRRRRDRPLEVLENEQCGYIRAPTAVQKSYTKEIMASQESMATSGILLHPLELRYDTIYLRQSEKPENGKQVDTPFKLIKLVPGVDVKEQLMQTIQPISLEDAKLLDNDIKETRKRQSTKSNRENKMTEQKDGEQLKTLLDTVEGIVRKYTARNDNDETKNKSNANDSLQQAIQRDISLIKPRPKVGRNMRAVSPESSPNPPPMLASFEAALRLRVADETIGEERVRRQYHIPLVSNASGGTSMLARHLLERGKIGCLPDV